LDSFLFYAFVLQTNVTSRSISYIFGFHSFVLHYFLFASVSKLRLHIGKFCYDAIAYGLSLYVLQHFSITLTRILRIHHIQVLFVYSASIFCTLLRLDNNFSLSVLYHFLFASVCALVLCLEIFFCFFNFFCRWQFFGKGLRHSQRGVF